MVKKRHFPPLIRGDLCEPASKGWGVRLFLYYICYQRIIYFCAFFGALFYFRAIFRAFLVFYISVHSVHFLVHFGRIVYLYPPHFGHLNHFLVHSMTTYRINTKVNFRIKKALFLWLPQSIFQLVSRSDAYPLDRGKVQKI